MWMVRSSMKSPSAVGLGARTTRAWYSPACAGFLNVHSHRRSSLLELYVQGAEASNFAASGSQLYLSFASVNSTVSGGQCEPASRIPIVIESPAVLEKKEVSVRVPACVMDRSAGANSRCFLSFVRHSMAGGLSYSLWGKFKSDRTVGAISVTQRRTVKCTYCGIG